MSQDAPLAGGAVGALAQARARSLVGRTVKDRYVIEELVAMGGIAAVFRARKTATGEHVAIKVLHPDAEELPELIQRFQREAVAGRHIYHPNVAAVYEADQLEDGSWYMVMEFIRGVTLRDLVDRGPVPPARAARIARQLAAALNAAHDMGIVHRDLKPLNVMILDGPDDRVQLIDFGLARVPVEELAIADESARRSLTNAGVVFGTVAYMAPEAALGMRSVDKRSDLYALGVILYEMLAGLHPFSATQPAALFAQHRNDTPPPIAERSPGVAVPSALEAVVRRLLAKDPAERFQHARALMVALDALQPELDAGPAAGGARRRRILLAAAALAALALVSLLLWLALRTSSRG